MDAKELYKMWSSSYPAVALLKFEELPEELRLVWEVFCSHAIAKILGERDAAQLDISKLELKAGEVLMVRVSATTPHEQMHALLQQLRSKLDSHGYNKTLAICCNSEVTAEMIQAEVPVQLQERIAELQSEQKQFFSRIAELEKSAEDWHRLAEQHELRIHQLEAGLDTMGCHLIRCSHCSAIGLQEPGHEDICQSCVRRDNSLASADLRTLVKEYEMAILELGQRMHRVPHDNAYVEKCTKARRAIYEYVEKLQTELKELHTTIAALP